MVAVTPACFCIAQIYYSSCDFPNSIQRADRLVTQKEPCHVELFKRQLCELFPVCLQSSSNIIMNAL